jgi:hypothetical protein
MNNLSSADNSTKAQEATTIITMNPEQVAQNIKDIARRIREESARMRDTVGYPRKWCYRRINRRS